jgi:hypothetical protein
VLSFDFSLGELAHAWQRVRVGGGAQGTSGPGVDGGLSPASSSQTLDRGDPSPSRVLRPISPSWGGEGSQSLPSYQHFHIVLTDPRAAIAIDHLPSRLNCSAAIHRGMSVRSVRIDRRAAHDGRPGVSDDIDSVWAT